MSYHSHSKETPEPMLPARHSPQRSARPSPPGVTTRERATPTPQVSPALIPVKKVMVKKGKEITLKRNEKG